MNKWFWLWLISLVLTAASIGTAGIVTQPDLIAAKVVAHAYGACE